MSVIDELLEKVPEAERAELERIRRIVHQTVPEADEVMTYGMPGFKYRGKYLVSFAAMKDHLSLFPGAAPIEALKDQLKAYDLSKGTIRFTLANPIPEKLIKQILNVRLKAIEKA
ncbi:MAG TPA: DUF1801 domain-containing protein [Candidatus Saccharimonadales bacterium]|nr:DUF1801 domain-containing protein [Candidatus Saccharimonadales bacterium]